ncbi:hypothetical protein D3C85_1358890 [compost metagenome]
MDQDMKVLLSSDETFVRYIFLSLVGIILQRSKARPTYDAVFQLSYFVLCCRTIGQQDGFRKLLQVRERMTRQFRGQGSDALSQQLNSILQGAKPHCRPLPWLCKFRLTINCIGRAPYRLVSNFKPATHASLTSLTPPGLPTNCRLGRTVSHLVTPKP